MCVLQTVIQVVALSGSLISFFALTLVYQAVCAPCFNLPSTYRVLEHALADPVYWLVLVLATVTALAPRLVYHAVRNSVRPGTLRRAVAARRRARAYAAHYRTDKAQAHVYRPTNDEDGAKPDLTAIT